MSTRANIILKDSTGKINLYRHNDGYINGGLGEELVDFINELYKSTYAYYSASCIANKIFKNIDDIEITTGIHGDVEYIYEITCKNGKASLKAYERTTWDIEPKQYKKWNCVKLC